MTRHKLATDYCPVAMSEQGRADEAYNVLRNAHSELEALYKSCKTATVADAIGRVLDAWPSESELYDIDLDEELS